MMHCTLVITLSCIKPMNSQSRTFVQCKGFTKALTSRTLSWEKQCEIFYKKNNVLV